MTGYQYQNIEFESLRAFHDSWEHELDLAGDIAICQNMQIVQD